MKKITILLIALMVFSVGFLSGCTDGFSIRKTDMSVEEIKSSALTVPYEDVMRYMEQYIDEILYFRGEVGQVWEYENNYYKFSIYTGETYYGGYHDDRIFLKYKGSRILEDDIVDVWGICTGYYEGETVLGASIKCPYLDVFHLEFINV